MGKQSKDRKAHFQSDARARRKIMSARLAPELVKQYGIKSIPICRGDKVIAKVGTVADAEGTVSSVYRLKFQVLVDGISRKNQKGEEKLIPMQASNLMITSLNMTNSRMKVVDRKAEGRKVF